MIEVAMYVHCQMMSEVCMQRHSICRSVCYCSSPAPGPVNSIIGFPLSSTSVELSWTPPTEPNGNITRYHIKYLSESKIGSIHDNREINVTAPAMNYTVTGLEENTLYHFTVSAENSAGMGEGSTVFVQTSINCESL